MARDPRWLADEVPPRPGDVPQDAVARVLRVAPEWAGARADVFLSSMLRNTSRTRARAIVEASARTPDGRSIRASDRLRAEERIVLWRRPVDDAPEALELGVIFEDEHLLVIDKPAHLTVHPTARHYHATVTKQLESSRPGEFFSLIHRLDKETSGILLLARSRTADRAFKQLLEKDVLRHARGDASGTGRQLRKTYLAITWGIPTASAISLPLEPDPDNPLRVKMRVAAPERGLEAKTELSVLDSCEGYALIACRLLTGRQHQIRVHLSAHGCPVVGDKLYGPDDRLLARAADGELTDDDLEHLELPRQALHAARYQLPHAITGEALDLRAPLPPDLTDFWQQVSGRPAPALIYRVDGQLAAS